MHTKKKSPFNLLALLKLSRAVRMASRGRPLPNTGLFPWATAGLIVAYSRQRRR